MGGEFTYQPKWDRCNLHAATRTFFSARPWRIAAVLQGHLHPEARSQLSRFAPSTFLGGAESNIEIGF